MACDYIVSFPGHDGTIWSASRRQGGGDNPPRKNYRQLNTIHFPPPRFYSYSGGLYTSSLFHSVSIWRGRQKMLHQTWFRGPDLCVSFLQSPSSTLFQNNSHSSNSVCFSSLHFVLGVPVGTHSVMYKQSVFEMSYFDGSFFSFAILFQIILPHFFFNFSLRLLKRGSMFVISDRQFRRVFHLADDYRAERMLDLGAGDGATTALLAGMFDHVHVTEMSWPMKRILAARGFT